MTYKDWLKEWLELYIKPSTKRRTYCRYFEIVDKHINPHLGFYELDDITPIVLQRYVTFLLQFGNMKTGKGLAANSVNSIINVLQSSLKTAMDINYMKAFPMDRIKRPKTQERKVECFSLQEQKKIEQAVLNAKKDKMIGVVLCLYTGLRIGEVLALKWSDIDFKKGLLTVARSCYDGKDDSGCYVRMEDLPKTQSSRRTIPIPKQLLSLLKAYKDKHHSDYVVSHKDKPISIRSYQRSFELLQKQINIPHRGFHSLRHTFATRALECGMDVKTLSEILGHKNATITLNRYVHSLMEHKQDMMNRLGRLF